MRPRASLADGTNNAQRHQIQWKATIISWLTKSVLRLGDMCEGQLYTIEGGYHVVRGREILNHGTPAMTNFACIEYLHARMNTIFGLFIPITN